MNKIRMCQFGFWAILATLAYVNGIDVKNQMIMGKHQLDRMCFKMNKMRSLGRPDSEIQSFLEDEMANKARVMMPDESSGRGYDFQDYPHHQSVHTTSKNEVGQNGHLYQIQLIGTDASTGTYTATSVQEHVNNYFDSADVSDFLLFVRPRIGTRNDLTNGQVLENRNTKVLKPIKRAGKVPLSLEECRKMIQTIYNLKIQDSILRKATKASEKLNEKAAEFPLHRSNNYDTVNSTTFDTQMSIGPGGVGTYIAHESRGEASNTASASDGELQVHGYYKNSDVSLKTISTSLAIA